MADGIGNMISEVLTKQLEIKGKHKKLQKEKATEKNTTLGTLSIINSTIPLTQRPKENSTYLNNTKIKVAESLSESTRGLMAIGSIAQWLPGPVSQAGIAAFKLSGGEALQNNISNYYTKKAESIVNPIVEPIKPELGIGYILYKAYTTQSLTVPYHNYNLQLTPNSGAINAKWDIK